jgi:DNA-binding GntR family transcriptional regulator
MRWRLVYCVKLHAAAIVGPVKIDHESADFPFEQLADQIRRRILSGEYGAGTKLPPVAAVVADLGVAADTIRRAYKVLASEGLVTIRPGRGTFVAKAPQLRKATRSRRDPPPG